jgi:type II secretory pathway component GspD/PulD (secretin)
VHTALNSAIDNYRRENYELAAKYFQQAEEEKEELSAAEKHDLKNWLHLNQLALQARKEGAEQLGQAEVAVLDGRTDEADALLKAVTANQFIAASDKQRAKQLVIRLQSGGTGVGSSTTPLALARAKLQQARKMMAERDYASAEALAGAALRMGAIFPPGDDTPLKVLEDINRARNPAGGMSSRADPRPTLAAARAALDQGDLDRAEQLGREAERTSVNWPFPMLADTPAKVLRDVQLARAKLAAPRAPAPPTAVQAKDKPGPATTTKPLAEESKANSMATTEEARQLLRQARKAMQAGDLAQAKKLQADVRALKAELNWWEDNPDKVLTEIQRLEGVKQVTAAKAAPAADAPATDPRALIRQGRDLLAAGKLDEAEKLVVRANLDGPSRWGLFEDSPEKLRLDIQKTRARRDQEEAGRLLAEARKLFEEARQETNADAKLEAAKSKAYMAERLHGPYGIWDLGDRPQKLIAEIETVQAKNRKVKLPPAPPAVGPSVGGQEVVANDKGKNPATIPPLAPPAPYASSPQATWPTELARGAMPTDARLAQAQKTLAEARALLRNGDAALALALVREVEGMGLSPDQLGPDTLASLRRDIELAHSASAPALPVVAAPRGGDSAKLRAQQLLAEARTLQRQGLLVEARQKVLEAQRAGAVFGADEDRPELALIQLAGLASKQIEGLLQEATDNAVTAAINPVRYQKAEADLVKARQLADSFGLDTQPIDNKMAWVRQTRHSGLGHGAAAGVKPGPADLGSLAQVQHTEFRPLGAAASSQHGQLLLEQARLEIQRGETGNARRLAVQAYTGPFGVEREAETVLRTIDAEEFNQTLLQANRTFDAALSAYQRKEYAQAAAMFRSLDVRMLSQDRQAKLKELMMMPELQPSAVNKPVSLKTRGGTATDGAGMARASDQEPEKQAAAGGNAGGTPEASYAQQVQALQEIQFQKLREDGLQAQREATQRFQAGDTDQALEILTDYVQSLRDLSLDAERVALLQRPIESRLQQFKTLKVQRDLEKQNAHQLGSARQAASRRALAEELKQKQVAELMKQYNAFFKEGKYKDAEMYAQRAHELDPDNPMPGAAIHVARIQHNQVAYKKIKDQKEEMFVRGLDDAENVGPAVDSENPLAVDAKVALRARERKPIPLTGLGTETKNEKEREIERRLSLPISPLDFKDTPLKQVIDDLRTWTGINIIADQPALDEEQISLDRPMTMRLDGGISLKSALNLLLHQVHLTYVIKDEVLQITTDAHARGKLVQRVYQVADLVLPVENHTLPSSGDMLRALGGREAQNLQVNGALPYLSANSLAGGSQVSSPGQAGSAPGTGTTVTKRGPSQTIEDVLMNMITNTIAPQSWSSVGGKGTIDYFPLGMALVINQTPDIQEQVAELLNSLRRLQELEVAVEVRFITLAEGFFERIGLDFQVNIKNSNTKYEPQLVTQQFRPPGFINDFSPSSFVTGLTPAGTFTSDLDIPIRSSSYGMAIPPFGGFPSIPGANGGLSLGLAFLSDIQVFMFMEAAQGDQRTQVMQAPKLTLFNGQTSTININDQQFFVTNVQVAQAGGQIVFIPQNQPLAIGQTSLSVQAVVSADRRYVRLSLQPNIVNLASAVIPLFPITTFITPTFEGGFQGQPIPFTQFIQQPTFSFITVQTTVSVPDGGTVLLGGLKRLSEGRNEFGPPILSKVPYINRLFKNVGYGREATSLLLMVTPRIIINDEEEQRQTGFVPSPPLTQ